LTSWLFRELKAGIDNPDINLIKDMFTGVFGESFSIRAGIAGTYWRALVRDNARYDFKHKILDWLGPTILLKGTSGALLWNEYSLPGNIFFGYVGDYIGFQDSLTHIGAGYAEAVDPSHKEIRNICSYAYLPLDRVPTLGDDPADYRAVQFGIDLWEKYGASLTIYQFRRELEQNYYKFTPPPSIPGSLFEGFYLGKWPYEVGDFNGYDEAKHWPPRPENGFGFYEP
jgi:hypothetical protein